jgi:hypothetical protein
MKPIQRICLFCSLLLVTLTDPLDAQIQSQHSYSLVAHNPGELAVENVAVRVELPPEAQPSHLLVIDEKQNPARVVPFQVNNGILTSVLSIAPNEKRQLSVLVTNSPVPLPPFEQKTTVDMRDAYRSFENNLMAFRIEVGPDAKTAGLAIDVFGKTQRGRGVNLQQIYATPDYHSMSDWGMDILKVGEGPGLGGIYLVRGNESGRTMAEETEFEILERGPVQTVVRATAPVQMSDRTFTLVRTMTLTADDRSIDDVVEVRGEASEVKDVMVAVGLRDLPDEQRVERPESGYAFVHGTGTEGGVKIVGLGAAFDSRQFIAMHDLPEGMGRVYLLKPEPFSEGVRSRHRLAAFWEHDSQITTPQQFEQELHRLAQRIMTPVEASLERRGNSR